MEERLRPIIKNYEISNLEDIKLAIKECDDVLLLKDYLEEVNDFALNNKIEGLISLSDALNSRLNNLNNDVKVKVEEEIKEEVEFPILEINNVISSYYNDIPVSLEAENKLNEFIVYSLEKMDNETLEYELQNSLDMYIVYLERKEYQEELSSREKEILNKYFNIIIKRENKLGREELTLNDEQKLVLKPKNLNTNGAVVTIVVLEVSILLGVLISVLALVKR